MYQMMENQSKQSMPRDMTMNQKDNSSPINNLAMSPSNQSIGMTNSYMVPNTPSDRNGGNMGTNNMGNNMINSNISNASYGANNQSRNATPYDNKSAFGGQMGQSVQPVQPIQPMPPQSPQNNPMAGMTMSLMNASTIENKKKTLNNLNFDKQALGGVINNWLQKAVNRSQPASPEHPNMPDPVQNFRLKPFPF